VAWYERQRQRDISRPCLYASASVMQSSVVPVLLAAAVPRSSVRLWSAHYTGTPHICGPASCKLTSIEMDGTQFADNALGRDLDESLLAADFFGTVNWQEAMMNKLPTLSQGAVDKSGQVSFVHRLQALVACFGRLNNIASAACVLESGTFDVATTTAVKAIQASRKLTVDGAVGPATWSVLITGSAP
jgi:peptidoglycan hydrolase-like protein with peptidoglycan-binding domain